MGKRRAAFGDDGSSDEGGRGGGGLGFGSGRRRGGGDDDATLGVFASGGFDSDEERKGKGKGKGKKGKKGDGILGGGPAAPVSFVKGKTIVPVEFKSKEKKEKKEGEKSDDEIDDRFVFAGVPAGGPVEHGPKPMAKNKLSFGQMSQEYGKGFAMMKKMGFTGGGLGRHNDGIANPIEVLQRQGRTGIQDEGERVDQDLYGTEATAERRTLEELLATNSKKSDGPKASEGWKTGKGGAKKQKTIYKEAEKIEVGSMRIRDMRGPEMKLVNSFSELASSLNGDTIYSLKELRHNTRLLVAKYEDSMRALLDKRRHYEDKLLAVASEKKRTDAAAGLTDAEVEKCKETVKEIEALRERQDQGSLGLLEMGEAFCKIRKERPQAFRALRLLEVALGLAMPTAKSELAEWKPLEAPQKGLGLLAPWRKLADAEDRKAFSQISEGVLLPRLRAALAGWKVRDVEPCLQLVEGCQKALPAEAVRAIGEELILPRLRAEVETWDPRVDREAIHLWIHPWLPLLGSAGLDSLWSPIRFKLSSMLERWKPKDHSAHDMVKPWRLCFDASNWEPLIEKVLSRLEGSIAEMPVKPDGQDLQPIQDLLVWQDIVPISNLASVLDVAFFPHWHAVLREWLRSEGCDFGEVLRWYQGWKTLLPAELREEGVVQQQYAKGLEVMKHFMAKGGSDAPGGAASEEEEEAPAARRAAAGRPAPARAPAEPTEDVSMSLSDFLTDIAGEEGLIFRPKKDRQHEGKQVYQLGSASIIMDRNTVYAAPKGGEGKWKLVSMDEVLALARATPKKK